MPHIFPNSSQGPFPIVAGKSPAITDSYATVFDILRHFEAGCFKIKITDKRRIINVSYSERVDQVCSQVLTGKKYLKTAHDMLLSSDHLWADTTLFNNWCRLEHETTNIF